MRHAVAVLCILGLVGIFGLAQDDEITVWQLPEGANPGAMDWNEVDGLFVSLQNPLGIGILEPATGILRTWNTGASPGEFVKIGDRLLTSHFFEGEISWLNTAAGTLSYFELPSSGARIARLVNADPTLNTITLCYLDWTSGNVGQFEPTSSGVVDVHGLSPRVDVLVAIQKSVTPTTVAVSAQYHPYDPNLPPATQFVPPTVTQPFTEWELFSPQEPSLAVACTSDGRIWVSCSAGEPLQALSPWNHEVLLYDLPGSPWVFSLAPGPDNEVCYLAQDTTGAYSVGVLEGQSGDVSRWLLPGASDPVNLRVIDGELWFADRELGAICRLTPWTSTLTRWVTGSEDGPLYIVAGDPGEYWITNERSAQIVRLRLP